MIWLTWRQLRIPAIALFGVLGVVILYLAVTGPGLAREGDEVLARCAAGGSGLNAACTDGFDDFFFPRTNAYLLVNVFVMAIPLAIGMFWGAPLIGGELERGTQDLAWQQSVSRRRWLAVKLAVVTLVALVAAGIAVVAVTWWSWPLDVTAIDGVNRMSPALFDARGFAVLGHTAFALMLGVTAGLLIRRTVAAMAVTFLVFVLVQVFTPSLVRTHFAAPERVETVVEAWHVNGLDTSGAGGAVRGLLVDVPPQDAWVLSNHTVDAAGRVPESMADWVAKCDTPQEAAGEPAQRDCLKRLADEGYRQEVVFHPAGRFWLFQTYETILFGLLALLLAAFSLWRLRPS